MATVQFVFELRAITTPLVATGAATYNYSATVLALPAGAARRYFELSTGRELNDFLGNNTGGIAPALQAIVDLQVHETDGRSRIVLTLTTDQPAGSVPSERIRVRAFEQVSMEPTAVLPNVSLSSGMFESVEDGSTLTAYMALLAAQPVLIPGGASAVPAGADRALLLTRTHSEVARTWIVVAEVGSSAAPTNPLP